MKIGRCLHWSLGSRLDNTYVRILQKSHKLHEFKYQRVEKTQDLDDSCTRIIAEENIRCSKCGIKPVNELDPKKVILSVCDPGEYYGRKAHLKLNLIAKTLHENITKACSFYSSVDLLEELYDLFDKVCYLIIEGSFWFDTDEDSFKAIEKSPSIYRYLLETTLFAGGSMEDPKPSSDVFLKFVEAASLFLETCNYSNYLYYGDFAGGFRVFPNGDIEAIIGEKAEAITKDFLKKMRARKKQVMLLGSKGSMKGDRYFESLAAEYNNRFKDKYDVDLFVLVKTVLFIFQKVCKANVGAIRIARRHLIKELRKEISGDRKTFKKILQLFEIGKDALSKDWQYYRFYNVAISVSRRPILNLSGKIGRDGTLLLGPHALLRAMGLLFNDIEKGLIELNLKPESLSEKRGHEFEKQVKNELQKHNFRAIRITDTLPTVGEIDVVALHEERGILFVVEAKSPKIKLDISRRKWQLERFRKWCEQLKPKVQWVKKNIELIKNRLRAKKVDIRDINGIIVVEVPWYCEPDSLFKMITFDEFELFLRGTIA